MEPRAFFWPMSHAYSLVARVMEPAYADIAGRIPVSSADTSLLDIGGGDGRLAIAIAGKYSFLSHIVTADISSSMAALAKGRIQRAMLGRRVHSELQDAHNLTYLDNTFDIVVSFGAMHHWQKPAKALLELSRVLKSSGRMCIFDGHGRPSFSRIREAMQLIGGSFWTAIAYWLGSKDVLSDSRIREIVDETQDRRMTIAYADPIVEVRYCKQ